MTNAIEKVLSALHARGCHPKRSGSGWAAQCPAHEDSSPSLNVAEGADGRALIRCHAGCSHRDVVRALALKETDLFAAETAGRSNRSRSAGRPTNTRGPNANRTDNARPTTTFATWQEALSLRLGNPSRVWTYADAEGQPVGIVARYDRDGRKEFRQASAAPGGGWVRRAMPEPRPLYNLAAVSAVRNQIVVVVEGEKCVDAVNTLGLTATTSPGGSRAADKADWSPLAGRRVVILPDHDEPGEHYSTAVAQLAAAAGAETVSVVRLADHWPACPEGGDVSDWIETFGDAAEPADILAALEKMLAAAEPVAAAEIEQGPEADEDDLAWVPFPTNELPEPVASFVRDTAVAIGCDPVMVALPMLGLIAGAIGNSRRLCAKPGWEIPPCLWTAVVGEPGSGKSPAFRAASKFLTYDQERAFETHAREMVEYETAIANYELQLKDRAKRGGAAPEKPTKPVARRFVVSDCTMEALVAVLQGNERGVVVAVDELAGWFTSHDAYRPGGRGGIDRPKWLSMYDAGPVTVDRKTSGTIHVPSAAVSITGGVQRRILAGLLTEDNVASGLVSRFIFAMPPRRAMKWSENSVGFDLQDEMANLFRTILGTGGSIREDGPLPLDFAPDGKAEFVRFADATYEATAEASGAKAAMLNKLVGLAGRLALVIHVVRQAGREPVLSNSVDLESVTRGIAIATWAAREQERVYQTLLRDGGVDETADDAQRLSRWLEGHGGVKAMRDIHRGLTRFHDERRAADAVSRLVEEGRAVRETVATGGRPSVVVRLVGAAM